MRLRVVVPIELVVLIGWDRLSGQSYGSWLFCFLRALANLIIFLVRHCHLPLPSMFVPGTCVSNGASISSILCVGGSCIDISLS